MTEKRGDAGSKAVALDRDPDEYVYQERKHRLPFGKTPYCLYFYYIGPPEIVGPEQDRVRKITHYFVESDEAIEREDVPEIVRTLALNARKPTKDQSPAPTGYNLQSIKWERKSYISFVIDDDNLRLKRDEAIEFDRENDGAENHSFFDGWDFDIYVGGKYRQAFCCINHVKRNQAGGDLGHDIREGETKIPEYFHFRLNTVPPQESLRPRFPDSGGTNMGPPVPPPY